MSGLDAVQFLATLFCCISSLSLPRRPSLFDKGHPVDGQYTTSALGRYTFAWAGRILFLAKSKKTLDLLDLPKLQFRARSAYLNAYFDSMKKRDKLWRAIILTHVHEIIFQTFYAIGHSAAQFVPQLAMYWLLKTIEQRSSDTPSSKAAWGLVFALGSSVILASWGQAWNHWIAWARLSQPVRSELSAMIFTKATRRKDVKGVGKAKIISTVESLSGTTATELNSPSGKNPTEPDPIAGIDPVQGAIDRVGDTDGDDIQKSRQSTINLVVSPVTVLGFSDSRSNEFITSGRRYEACLRLLSFLFHLSRDSHRLDSQHYLPGKFDWLGKPFSWTGRLLRTLAYQHLCFETIFRRSRSPYEGPGSEDGGCYGGIARHTTNQILGRRTTVAGEDRKAEG